MPLIELLQFERTQPGSRHEDHVSVSAVRKLGEAKRNRGFLHPRAHSRAADGAAPVESLGVSNECASPSALGAGKLLQADQPHAPRQQAAPFILPSCQSPVPVPAAPILPGCCRRPRAAAQSVNASAGSEQRWCRPQCPTSENARGSCRQHRMAPGARSAFGSCDCRGHGQVVRR
jgi:hypothetical protein